MKVLITGGLGQIGSFCADLLADEGYSVCIIDNLSTGKKYHLQDHIANIEVHLASIEDRQTTFSIFRKFKPDIVIHSAASFKDPDDYIGDTLTNCVGSINVFDSCKEVGVSRLIYMQTSLCYGNQNVQDQINTDHPLDPGKSSYAISKTTAELYLFLSGLDFVSFRLANVIGPRNLTGPLPIFYHRLKHDLPCIVTNSKRDFVSALDLSKLVLKACQGLGKGVYHFSSGTDMSIFELFKMVVNKMNLDINTIKYSIQDIRKDDVQTILLNPAKTIKDFGQIIWTPIDHIVSEAIDYYERFGVNQQYTHLKIY